MGSKLTLPEVSKRASAAETTVRRWISTGKLHAEKNADGNWEIDSEVLAIFLAKETPRTHATMVPPGGGGGEAVASTLAEALRQATASLERERHINDELRAELREVRGENRALQAEMRAILSGEQETAISRWVRTHLQANPPPGPLPGASMEHPPVTNHQEIEVLVPPPEEARAGASSGGSTLEAPPIRRLSAFAEKVLALHAGGKSEREIAAEMGKNVPAVRTVLNRYISHEQPKPE